MSKLSFSLRISRSLILFRFDNDVDEVELPPDIMYVFTILCSFNCCVGILGIQKKKQIEVEEDREKREKQEKPSNLTLNLILTLNLHLDQEQDHFLQFI